jgi:hypothetical protein
MSVSTKQYIRKPLYVDAVRVSSANFDEIANWCQGQVQEDDGAKGTGKKFIRIRVHNPINPRQTQAFIGDWILYTEKGYKIYSNQAFRASFDEVPDDPKPGDVVMGSEEILPGMTLNQLVAKLKAGELGFVPVIKDEQQVGKAA